jgi:hypothetical protein
MRVLTESQISGRRVEVRVGGASGRDVHGRSLGCSAWRESCDQRQKSWQEMAIGILYQAQGAVCLARARAPAP